MNVTSAEAQPYRQLKVRILFVEDEILIRALIAEELRDNGYCVIEAANYEEAVVLLHSIGSIDLVFTDVKMPGHFDGLDLARVVREGWPALNVIVTSGHLVPGDIDPGGTVRFLTKPYSIEKLLQLLEQVAPRWNTRPA
jgi:CheY-like chemotaxis protein